MVYKHKIAVNTRLLLRDKMDGIGYFAYEALLHIVRRHPEVEFHFLFDRPYDPDFVFADNIVPVVLFPQARHPFLWYWWFEWSVAGYLRQHKFGLFLSPDGYCSLCSDTPTVAVMHDIAYEHYPSYVPWITMKYYKYFMPRFAKHATRIATVSEYSKADIASYYGVSPDKIDVVYNGVKDIFEPATTEEKDAIRAQYSGGKPYLIFVGSIHPRKNLKNMLLAFDAHRKARPDSALHFIVAGAFGWQNSELKGIIDSMQHRDDVIFLGRQTEAELVRLVAGAFALMYLSMFEGFGVPPLEAMRARVPAITSPVSSLPEISGDGALYADPLDPVAIRDAITSLWDSPALRRELIDKGAARARLFTWERTAALLWDCCVKCISHEEH